jgi:uncharacterized protein YdaU (DUF1376 family)
MNYYNFHIGDYISHTIHLSVEEDLAYRRLLDMYYDTELPIPNNIPLVSRKLRINAEVVKTVLHEFFELTEEGFKNFRADNEIAEYQRFIEKQKANGRKGGRPKKSQRKPTANPTESQKKPNQEPLTNNQEPINTETTSLVVSPSEKTPSAPITEIVDLYNSRLPMLPRVTVVSDSRKRLVAARWRDVVSADKLDRERGLEFFDWFFVHVGKSKFLTGRSKDWKANFEFLFTASKFPRIVEGAYHQEQT